MGKTLDSMKGLVFAISPNSVKSLLVLAKTLDFMKGLLLTNRPNSVKGLVLTLSPDSVKG